MTPLSFTFNSMIKLTHILLVSTIAAGCAPQSGQSSRDPDEQAVPGAGTASLSWDIGSRDRQPTEGEIQTLRSGPTPPARNGE